MAYEINHNEQYNSQEVTFDGKPAQEVIDALKNLGMRWHYLRRCWYGYATESAIKNAILATNAGKSAEDGATVTTPGYLGGGAYYGAKSNKHLYGAELSAAIREELKRSGIKGASVRVKTFTGGQEIGITATFTAADVVPFEQYAENYEIRPGGWIYYKDDEGKEQCIWHEQYYKMNSAEQRELRRKAARYEWEKYTQRGQQLNKYYLDDYKQFTTAFLEKLKRIRKIANAYNYDESNGMVDYFDTGFYLFMSTKLAA